MTSQPLADDRVALECPSCGTPAEVDVSHRNASDFCPVCDYPLFWARSRVDPVSGDAGDDSGLRRLPGTAGRAALAAVRCPACTELNPPSNVRCLRCNAELFPKAPEPEPVPVPVVVKAPAPVPAPPPKRRWWIWYLVAALIAIGLIVGLIVGTN